MRSKAIQVNRVSALHLLCLLGCKREFTLLQPKVNPSKSFWVSFCCRQNETPELLLGLTFGCKRVNSPLQPNK